MSCRRMVFAGLLVGAVVVAGCSNGQEAATATSSAAPTTTVAPRPMTDYLVSNADTPEITYVLPAAVDAVTLGTVGVASGKNTPECAARNAAIPMLAADPLTSALVRVETADGKPRYDVQIAATGARLPLAAPDGRGGLRSAGACGAAVGELVDGAVVGQPAHGVVADSAGWA